MANVRSVGYSLANEDDDEAFQVVIGDLQRIYQAVFTGTPNAAYSLTDAAATAVGAPPAAAAFVGFTAQLASAVAIAGATTLNTWSSTFTSECFSTVGAALGTTTFTAPVSGYYHVSCAASIAGLVGGGFLAQTISAGIYLLRNGSLTSVDSYQQITMQTVFDFSDYYSTPRVDVVLLLSAGETVSWQMTYAGPDGGGVTAYRGTWSTHLIQAV